MSSEKTQRQRIVKALKPLHACSVENSCMAGFPDVVFIGGMIEAKCLDAWPKRKGVVRLKHHFTALQRLFARTWTRKGGFHAVCLQVDQDWFLLDGLAAATHLERDWTEEDIRRECLWSSCPLDEAGMLAFLKIHKGLEQAKRGEFSENPPHIP